MLLRRVVGVLAVMMLGLGAAACSDGSTEESNDGSSESTSGEKFPDVVEAQISGEPQGPYSIAVTMSSPYDSPERYADAMRVRSADGDVYGERKLTHDHASEQPFTRDITNVEIPDGVTEVVVEGHDQQSGWGGGTVTINVP